MSYRRVLPRDLFNEAKLLKCLGRLVMLIEDGMIEGLTYEYLSEPEGFHIELDQDNCVLFCDNIVFRYGENKGDCISFGIPYNSRNSYPLQFFWQRECPEGKVFREDGTLTTEFREFLTEIKQ